jgi:O-antigen/teichoic acid export membrane protein
VKFVSEADEWTAVATSVLHWRIAVGAVATIAIVIGAGLIAKLLRAPELSPYLRVFAIDLFLFNVARSYRDTLTGTGRFRELAVVAAVRWIARMVLIVTLVSVTGSVMAAVIGSVGATFVEVVTARRYQHVPLRERGGVTVRQMWGLAAPLLVYGVAMQLYVKVDLFALSALGGTKVQAGYYAAAQNLAVAPGLFAMSFAPLLLATLGRLNRSGDHAEARWLGRTALRITVALIPIAALVAATSGDIVRVIFGAAFVSAAPLLALLFFAAVALAVTSVSVAILTAASRPGVVSLLGIGVLGTAVTGHLILIPLLGPPGAATVTAATGGAGALIALLIVHRVWHVQVYATAIRAILIGAPVYWAAVTIATPAFWSLIAKLVLLSAAAAGAFVLLGEMDRNELGRLRMLLRSSRFSSVL